jgi:hypothetical protein
MFWAFSPAERPGGGPTQSLLIGFSLHVLSTVQSVEQGRCNSPGTEGERAGLFLKLVSK